ncbi:dienelactone hydrolase [Bradyrhizobium sp. WBOS4]|nr:dienelactone hydrolase [Bradyrhizobium sp. WBOS8]MDD1586226.1 dienelactone hydrolase [Bradyrhizobium sp. WBOS4]UUO47029.1 dienelactone hydrolase [Bradyrhizobium sp. WBOS04]UUO60646.1 dienelactone hydrolase [Bradyrhizobium sp. WBOS08]
MMFCRRSRVIMPSAKQRWFRHLRRQSPMRLRLTALFAMLLISAARAAPAPLAVEIPLASGILHAQLYKPDGAGPFPTVIALHGCGGLSGHSDSVLPRYRDWAERLLKAGNAVLWPDSYGSRELGPQCRVKEMHVKARRERVGDIAAARAWLMKQSWVARDRVSLMGWANGASALLWAVRPQSAARDLGPDLGPDFRAAIAFYPDCRISAGLGWSTRVPTLVLIGADDDVSSPPACRQMVEGAHGRSALARIVVYPGADHDFDRATTPLHASNDAAAIGRGHPGMEAQARAESQKDVVKWLAR